MRMIFLFPRNCLAPVSLFLMLILVPMPSSAATIYVSDDSMNLATSAYIDRAPGPQYKSASYSGAAWLPKPLQIESTLTNWWGGYSSASSTGYIGPTDGGSPYLLNYMILGQIIDYTSDGYPWFVSAGANIYTRLNVVGGNARGYYTMEAFGAAMTDMILYDETAGTTVFDRHITWDMSGTSGFIDLLEGRTYSFFGRSYSPTVSEFGLFTLEFEDKMVHVPEPSTLALLGSGFAWLLVRRRRT